VSTIGTYNYDASKYLASVLTNNFSTKFKFVIKDSFDFINKLSKFKLEEGDYLASFDVTALYDNVPINETMACSKDKKSL
jgi:hypothetical protein